MCGKFTAMASWSETDAFVSVEADQGDNKGEDDYEVTFRVMGLVPLLIWDKARGERRVIAARWGFPHAHDWRRPQPIHARAETIETIRAFADAFRGGQESGGRGIVLVKTFNEAPESGEQHVFEPDAAKTGIAFVWRSYNVGAAVPLIACVMVTVPANRMIAALPSDRMPAILEPSDWAKWIGEEPATTAELKAMLKTREGVNWKMRREYRAKVEPRPIGQKGPVDLFER
ncbi:MAG TPA: SOS response-associated peptidase family protein [Rhizomicrobium sp.]|nr:SOS response-associated peptidase family protein [Rhizomicrobium sp.]